MNLLLRLCFVLLLSSFVKSVAGQAFAIGHRQQSFTDPTRSNRIITTEIYYPAATTGDNVAVVNGQFPILVFGHGFLMTWSAYDVIWNSLVPNGYVMVFPTTETSFSPSHIDFGKDIAFLVGAMKTEGATSTSAFFNTISNTSAVMGHSMGGGSAFLAVQYDPTITAIATLAAANTNPSAILAASGITIPSLVLSGGNDCVTPPPQHQIPMYDSLNSSCKSFVSVTGGSHCQFANYNASCYFGEGTCSPQATILPSAQQYTAASVLLPWLNFYLKNDCNGAVQFQNLLSAANGITSQQNCVLACTSVQENIHHQVRLFPNPVNKGNTITISLEDIKNAGVRIMDVTGKNLDIHMEINSNSISIETGTLLSGVLFVEIYTDKFHTEHYKLLVQD